MGNTPQTRSHKSRLPPGTPVHIGERKMEKVILKIHTFSQDHHEYVEAQSAADIAKPHAEHQKIWVNVQGLQHVETLEALANTFGWHPLVLEDLVNTSQRPKLEDYGNYLYIVLKRLRVNDLSQGVQVDQVSLIQGQKYVITFQEGEDDVFCYVSDRLQNNLGRMRTMETDYLAYEMIDAVVDQYFGILEHLDSRIESLDHDVLERPNPAKLQKLHRIKRDTITIRSSIWPLREVIHHLQHSESPLMTDATSVYYRDVYDHIVSVIESIEISRDILSGMQDVYLTSLSNRMNETMKVLTVIATIFIPLTFLTGIFGMNFRYMPIIESEWGVQIVIVLMVLLAGGMFTYFKRKKWI